MLSWQFFTHYLLSRRSGAIIRVVAWMSMLGIAVGVAALIIVLGVMGGFNQVIRERHLRVEPHLVVHAPKDQKSMEWLQAAEVKIKQALGDDWAEVTPYTAQDVILKTVDGFFSGAIAKGMDHPSTVNFIERIEKPDSRSMRHIETPRPPADPESYRLGPNEVFIGSELGEALRLVQGDKIVLIAPEALLLPADEAPPMQTVEIRGFFMSQLADVDSKLVVFNNDNSMQSLKDTASREMGLEVRLKRGDDYEGPLEKLREIGLDVQSWPERNAAMFFALKMEKLAMTVFLSLSALITSFSLLTVLILLITQKRKEIGILKAMGMTAGQTRSVFGQLGLWLAFIGVSAGTIVGVVVCYVVDRYTLPILPNIYYDRTIPAEVSPTLLAVLFLAALVIAAVGSWVPAHMSAKLLPSEALRGNMREP